MERKSNIELLRIILFLMVVCIHITGVGLTTRSIEFGTLNWHYSNLLDSLSRCAVNVFVLISGYFMCIKDIKVKKSILKLVYPILRYIPLFYIYCVFVISIDKDLVSFIKNLMTNQGMFYHLWYVQVMIVLVVLVPFINILLQKISKQEHKKLLYILYIFVVAIPTINFIFQNQIISEFLFNSRLGLFTALYIQGAYIRKYGINISRMHALIGFFISAISTAAFTFIYNSNFNPIYLIAKGMNKKPLLNKNFVESFYDYPNIMVIAMAVFLFLYFERLDTKNIMINKVASYTYGAYIIHTLYITALQSVIPTRFLPFANYNSTFFPIKNLGYIIVVAAVSLSTEAVLVAIINEFCNIKYKLSNHIK